MKRHLDVPEEVQSVGARGGQVEVRLRIAVHQVRNGRVGLQPLGARAQYRNKRRQVLMRRALDLGQDAPISELARVDPEVSRLKDLDGFVRRLTSCNQQRVKNVAEKVRESMVTMDPDTFHRVCDYRKSVSNVDGAEVFQLTGEKKRSAIAQKRSLAEAIIRTVKDRYARMGPNQCP